MPPGRMLTNLPPFLPFGTLTARARAIDGRAFCSVVKVPSEEGTPHWFHVGAGVPGPNNLPDFLPSFLLSPSWTDFWSFFFFFFYSFQMADAEKVSFHPWHQDFKSQRVIDLIVPALARPTGAGTTAVTPHGRRADATKSDAETRPRVFNSHTSVFVQ